MSAPHPDERHSDYVVMQMNRKASRVAMWAMFAFAIVLLAVIIYAGIAGGGQNLVLLPLVLFPIVWGLRLMTKIDRSEKAEAKMRANDRAGRSDGPADRIIGYIIAGVIAVLAFGYVGTDFLFNIGDYSANDLGWIAVILLPAVFLAWFAIKMPRRTDRPIGTPEQELIWARQTKGNTLRMWLVICIFGCVMIGGAYVLTPLLLGPQVAYVR